ncbi:hypothetical protein HYH03_009441 [Edaphochlamys debaryana]|uniref:Uncharacterized protein n=1 Tax=Edaphochlamys debaryana TaxID=47281 RepID=A0A835XYP5_9CHLO|nr:hypothetical protein HYH03_009441 [Edaphochlamys debaryana]|eukprot:KAG2492194.1 hypothetical protein HYH03_009441 [Edaphochlamys debaryana]
MWPGSSLAPGARESAAPRSSRNATAAPPLLPSSLRSVLQELPGVAEGLLGKSGRRRDVLGHTVTLSVLFDALNTVPLDSPPHAAAMAEVLSSHPDSAKALLRLHAAALREGGAAEGGAAGGGGGSGNGKGASALAGPAGADLRDTMYRCMLMLLYRCTPLPASRHALTVLRFVRAMLRGQMLRMLSGLLAAAAAALEGASKTSGGARGARGAAAAQAVTEQARETLGMTLFHITDTARNILLCDNAFAGLLFPKAGAGAPTHIAPPPELAAAVAEERAAGVEELARGLAESSVLEHAARVLLLLQARGPQAVRPLERPEDTLASTVCAAMEPGEVNTACPNCATPAAAADIRKALSGRCVHTAVLVYGVCVLRLVDRGPTYGLPAALQTAGLSAFEIGQREPEATSIGLLLLQMTSSTPLLPAGRNTRLELALRIGQTAWWTAMKDRPSLTRPPTTLAMKPGAAVRLLVAALECGRRFLPEADVTPAQAQRRAEWWRLAKWPLVCGIPLGGSGRPGHTHQRFYDIMVDLVMTAWPDGRLELDALPAEPPAEVAAALAGGLLSALASLPDLAAASPEALGAISDGLLAACDRSPPDGTGFTLFLVPLLAYGSILDCEGALEAIGLLAGFVSPWVVLGLGYASYQYAAFAAALHSGRAASMRRAAACLLASAHDALQRRSPSASAAGAGAQLGATAGGAPNFSFTAGAAAAASSAAGGAASSAADPLWQLRGMVALAAEMWGLQLPAPRVETAPPPPMLQPHTPHLPGHTARRPGRAQGRP